LRKRLGISAMRDTPCSQPSSSSANAAPAGPGSSSRASQTTIYLSHARPGCPRKSTPSFAPIYRRRLCDQIDGTQYYSNIPRPTDRPTPGPALHPTPPHRDTPGTGCHCRTHALHTQYRIRSTRSASIHPAQYGNTYLGTHAPVDCIAQPTVQFCCAVPPRRRAERGNRCCFRVRCTSTAHVVCGASLARSGSGHRGAHRPVRLGPSQWGTGLSKPASALVALVDVIRRWADLACCPTIPAGALPHKTSSLFTSNFSLAT
jgi:hypothetical protein